MPILWLLGWAGLCDYDPLSSSDIGNPSHKCQMEGCHLIAEKAGKGQFGGET